MSRQNLQRFDGWIRAARPRPVRHRRRGARDRVGDADRDRSLAPEPVRAVHRRHDRGRGGAAAADRSAAGGRHFVAATYTFDAVEVARAGVTATRHEWAVSAGPLHVAFEIGRRAPLGWLLRAVPPRSPGAGRPGQDRQRVVPGGRGITITDGPVRRLVPGVRTVGSTGSGRREYDGARDLHPTTASVAWLDGADLGPLAKVDPSVRLDLTPPLPLWKNDAKA